jgi:hypothetical protein
VADQTPSQSAQAEVLREEAIALCKRSGWSPQCIGTEQFKIGVSEIYEELRCLQKVCCVDISEELIECCRKHRQWSPLFDDVEARIAMFRGETNKAELIWSDLLNHQSEMMHRIADQSLRSLYTKRDSGEQLVDDVLQALDHDQQKLVDQMLCEAVMVSNDLSNAFLVSALEIVSRSRSKPEHWPWNRELLIDQLMLTLFEQQLLELNNHVE